MEFPFQGSRDRRFTSTTESIHPKNHAFLAKKILFFATRHETMKLGMDIIGHQTTVLKISYWVPSGPQIFPEEF
jgi:hypothetical protein